MQKTVKTYAELGEWVGAFAAGAMDILIVEGNPGIGKSTIVKGVMPKDTQKVEGRISALCFYERLFEHRDCPFVIDDVDDFYRDKMLVNLLKCLCQTEAEKTVAWDTKTKRANGTPATFTTKSKIAVLTNRWESFNKHVGAVEDRGLLVRFTPSAQEVHRYVQEQNMPIDNEVYAFIGEHIPMIASPSIRHYRNASQLKAVEMDWRAALIESFGLTKDTILLLTLATLELTERERIERFTLESGKTERTYYRLKGELKENGVLQ